MKTLSLNPSKIRPYEKNPRIISDEAVDKIAESIREFGFNQPIVVNQDNIICAGHTRYKAALKLGLKKIPVWKFEMTEEQFKKFNLMDNKSHSFTEWDYEGLSEVFRELKTDFNLENIGFNENEINSFLFEDEDDSAPSGESEGEDGEKIVKVKGENYQKIVQLAMTIGEHASFMQKCEALKSHFGTETVTAAIIKSVEVSFDNIEKENQESERKARKKTKKKRR